MPVRQHRHARAAVSSLAALILLLTALVQSVAAAPKPDPRIIGGEPADFGEYPFVVALLLEPTEGNDFQKQYCGGSLIASRWVLTAAHCVDFLQDPSEVAVAVSRTHLNSTEGARRDVKAIYIHPDWNRDLLSPDVALLELKQPVTGITPIQLAVRDDDSFEAAGTPLTVIGWGNTDVSGHPSFPDELREVIVPAVSDAECAKVYHGFFNPETMLCAGEGGIDSCQGDSGGPLFATTSNDTFVQVGIVSWGVGCAKNHFPGVYAEASSPTIRDFISDVSGV